MFFFMVSQEMLEIVVLILSWNFGGLFISIVGKLWYDFWTFWILRF